VLWWHHSNPSDSNPIGWTGNSSTGGVFYTGTTYPAQYQGAYFFGDYGQSWIRVVQFDASHNVTGTLDFSFGAAQPVGFEADPVTGDIYYAAAGAFQIRRICYGPCQDPPPPGCGDNVREGAEQCDGTDEGICPGVPCTDWCRCDWPPGTKIVELRADQANGTGPYPSSPGNGSPWVDLMMGHNAALQAFAAGDADSGWQGTGLPPIGANPPDPYRLEWDGAQGQTAFITGGSIPQLNPYDPNDGYSMTMWFRTDSVAGIANDDREILVEWRDVNTCPYAGINVSYGTLPGPLAIWTCCSPGSGWVTSTGIVGLNEWHHLAVTKIPGAVRMYLDGGPSPIYEALDPSPESFCLGSQVDDLLLGAGNAGGPGVPTPATREMAGAIAQFALYNGELDASQVFADYAADAALYQCVDLDGDGITNCNGDCDDNDPDSYPGHAELCDGADNDCDTQVDEDFPNLGQACMAGLGECEAAGVYVCSGDELGTECGATPGDPSPELCDGLDNDCDGTADEDFPNLGQPCTVGSGECEASGVYICTGDQTGTECDATPSGGSPEVCDGVDNDCDTEVDEDFPNLGQPCTVGVGECEDSDVYVCTGDQQGTECGATPGTPSTELCDGLDNDCDTEVDEDFPALGQPCTAGVGECEASGVLVCSGDQQGTECGATPGDPVPELCDGLDNDCDGTADDGNPEGGSPCSTGLPGICADGSEVCQSGNLECLPDEGPITEICGNGLDDDCDGEVDDPDVCAPVQHQNDAQQSCINELNKGLGKVAKAQGKDLYACLKNGAKGRLGAQTIEACLTADNKGKVAKAKQQTFTKAPPKCTDPPDFGATDPNTVSQAAVGGMLDMTHDIFGSDLDGGVVLSAVSDPTGSKCQTDVAKQATKCWDTKLKEFNRCKKQGLRATLPFGRASDLEGCMGVDLKGKILKACVTKLADKIGGRCTGVDTAVAFPGCNTGDLGELGECLDRTASTGTAISSMTERTTRVVRSLESLHH
jgi:hypothetical protein